ncbi:hypothetical protein PaecuDRAFT_3420 [Paenibacillus curdlanolyticus YK9]|uniref:Uncharacterized protein n=1 Tax=Paenibacillus curdlanolyticus YK9 TaxID=717606 RepID=E0ICN1_9BACL|nr:hypothetical protein PaecuDRAFT_3420 [Paenibacillus curdlanolyticus YK9]
MDVYTGFIGIEHSPRWTAAKLACRFVLTWQMPDRCRRRPAKGIMDTPAVEGGGLQIGEYV